MFSDTGFRRGRWWGRLASASLALGVLAAVPSARAQTINGQISGTVFDTQKARLPGVSVTVTNEGDSARRATTATA
jgi:hypothetical protein